MKVIIQVPIDRELVERLDRQAKNEAVSRAALIRTACARYLRQLERDEQAREYVEGYLRMPDETTERESLAWLAAAGLPAEEWPEAPARKD